MVFSRELKNHRRNSSANSTQNSVEDTMIARWGRESCLTNLKIKYLLKINNNILQGLLLHKLTNLFNDFHNNLQIVIENNIKLPVSRADGVHSSAFKLFERNSEQGSSAVRPVGPARTLTMIFSQLEPQSQVLCLLGAH